MRLEIVHSWSVLVDEKDSRVVNLANYTCKKRPLYVFADEAWWSLHSDVSAYNIQLKYIHQENKLLLPPDA